MYNSFDQFKRSFLGFVLSFGVLILLTGCQRAQGPESGDLAIEIEDQFRALHYRNSPNFFSIENVRIVETENIGSRVEPEILGRYSADAKLTQPVYVGVFHEAFRDTEYTTNLAGVEPKYREGHTAAITGTYRATVDMTQADGTQDWSVSITDLDIVKNSWRGKPLSDFGELWNGQDDLGNRVPYIVTPEKLDEALALAAKQEQAYADEKRTWLDSLVGKWFVENILPSNTWHKHEACGNASGTQEPFKVQATLEIPEGIEDRTELEVIATVSSTTYPDYSYEVPLVFKPYFEKSFDSSIRRPRSIYLAVKKGADATFICPNESTYKIGFQVSKKQDTFPTFTSHSGPVADGAFKLLLHGKSGSGVGELVKVD